MQYVQEVFTNFASENERCAICNLLEIFYIYTLSIGYFSSVSSTVPFLSDHPSGFYYIDSLVPVPDDVHRRHKLSSLLPLMTSQDVQNSYVFL